MAQIDAIVFDSNVFGSDALPNIKTVERWAEACDQHDAELWIPEVVAYELAQHALEAHEDFAKAHGAHRRKLAAWGQPSPAPLDALSVRSLVEALEAAGAVIVPLEGDEARDAILDQVLLRGVGQRKQGVKTGAADSAWVRSVIAYNGGETDGLVVVTGDTRALERTCDQLGVEPPRYVKHLGELRHLLNESLAADQGLIELYKSWLGSTFVDAVWARRAGPGADLAELADLGGNNWWTLPSLDDDGYEPWELQAEVVSPVQSAVVVGEVEQDRWADSLSAQIELESDVEEHYARQDKFGDYLQYQMRAFPGRVRARVTVYYDGDVVIWDDVLDEVELVAPSAEEIVLDTVT